MALLVTGGAGYIGSHMAWHLLDAGEDVVVMDDLSSGSRSAVPSGADFIEGDVGDRPLVSRILKQRNIEAVIHFAGSIVVPDSMRDPLEYYRNNTCASRSLIQACVEARVDKFIFSSTAAVYGSPRQGVVDEKADCRPVSPYGHSKLMVEQMLLDAASAYDLRFVALRYFNVAGADPLGRTGQSSQDATHLIKVACQAALGLRDGVSIFGTDYPTPDGTGVRDYIHVTDLVEAHLQALHYLRGRGRSTILNCGYGRGYSVREVVETVRHVSGRQFPAWDAERRAGDSAQIVSDCSMIRKVLGWHPSHDDLRTIVADAWNWEQVCSAKRPSRERSPARPMSAALST